MARYLARNFSNDYAHYTRYYVVFIWSLTASVTSVFARPAATDVDFENGQDSWITLRNYFGLAPLWPGILLSLCFLIILAYLMVICGAGGCCGKIHWFGRRRQEAPLSFSNPMTEPGSTMMVPISQIDVRALELDPIVFEPLPTVHDLTPHPLGNKIGNTDRGLFNHRNSAVPIVPFNSDDSAVYAHDWFEEPLNNFPRSNIEYVKEIGKGWFGQVIEAEARDIVPFARKMRVIVKLLREDANGMEQMRFLDESRMYRDANHGNILKLLGHSIEKLPFLLIMEHCPQGDLKSFLISNVIRAEMLNSQGTIIKMALDVAKGLEWLHNTGFVHPDLAARNCQVGSENRVVIGDYGLGTQNFKDDYHWSANIAIPLRWTAPETLHCTNSVIQILKVTESSNIWTLGVVIWEICEFGKLPYFELADDEVISRVIIDKTYFLGRPTLPCMSAKEDLYKIMSSCWESEIENRPRLYNIVRELEEIYQSCTSNTTISTPKDEFDSKWEQLGGRAGSEDDKRRKKNVSFLDLENHIKSSGSASFSDKEAMRNTDLAHDASNVSAISHDPLSTDQTKDSEPEADLDEEQWTKKIERGDITQKVLEKSQSVQDLMVLTHFEQSDMGDLDSLVYVGGNKSSQMSSQPDNNNSNSTSKEGAGSNNSILRKTCSETAIDVLSLANSSHTLTPNSACDSVSPSSTMVPQSPLTYSLFENTPNRAGVDLHVIPATPNPPVEVNVISATPNRSCETTPDKADKTGTNGHGGSGVSSNPVVNRKLQFKFDDSMMSPISSSKQRQTSTPKRSGSTPSPRISDFEDNDAEEEYPVFDTSRHYMDGTFSLSPISQHYITSSTLNSTLMETTDQGESVLYGASDDHELGSYQGVKSQLHDKCNIPVGDENELEDSSILANTVISTGEKQELPRRILFPNGVETEDKKDPSSSLDCPSSVGSTEANGFSEPKSAEDSSFYGGHLPAGGVSSVEHDDFWKKQLISLQMAADNTRELFQTGLNDAEENLRSLEDKRFVEDIEADVEELGSLVLHDLEEPDAAQTVIKETREVIKPDEGVSAKLAFQATSSSSEVDKQREDVEPASTSVLSEVESADSNDLWDINNSIEISKVKTQVAKRAKANAEAESDIEEEEEATSTEFVPSQWNQSLIPSRSAIKSPEQQQPKSGMKKSVSFEMKKTQLVYEYPPPPVASDSEDEEKVATPMASASIPFSASLDWELTQEELEHAEWHHEDWEEEVVPKPGDPMDVYRISGINEDSFQVRGSSEPFVFPPSTLGELRHTRDRLRLDLSRGEANFLDEDPNKSSNPAKLDSGVGSSTNVSPFNNCDILTKRSKTSD